MITNDINMVSVYYSSVLLFIKILLFSLYFIWR